jgi:hypothetical protein
MIRTRPSRYDDLGNPDWPYQRYHRLKKWTPIFKQKDQGGGVKMERIPNGRYTKEFGSIDVLI